MSKYKQIETEYRNAESLFKALGDVGVIFKCAPDLKTPSIHLVGWHNDERPELASIQLPRESVNRWSGRWSNDIGFAWNGRSFAAIVSDYDQSNLGSQRLLNAIKQRYAYHEVSRQARVKGYTVRETAQPDGSIRMTLTRR